MLISVREAYKYARKHIEKDRLAPLSPVGVEDFGEHREKARVLKRVCSIAAPCGNLTVLPPIRLLTLVEWCCGSSECVI